MNTEDRQTSWQKFKRQWNPIRLTPVRCVHCGKKTNTFVDIDYTLLCMDIGLGLLILYIILRLMGV
jgi:hypothetical protein